MALVQRRLIPSPSPGEKGVGDRPWDWNSEKIGFVLDL